MAGCLERESCLVENKRPCGAIHQQSDVMAMLTVAGNLGVAVENNRLNIEQS